MAHDQPLLPCRLAPGVNYCQELGQAGLDVLVDVKTTFMPDDCKRKVKKDSQLLLILTGDAGPSVDGPWERFVSQEDFTVAEAIKLNAGQVTLTAV